jgi:hypothetical protein
MHVVVALGVAVVAILALVLLAGMTPFVGIPIVMVALGVAALWAAAARRAAERRLETDAPSSAAASHDPVVRPPGPS